MTSSQRTAIASPAEGLLVYDTDESAFYYYGSSVWEKLGEIETRDNYKLIKSEADLADELTAGGGAFYELDTNTLYEINGEITLVAPIDLNSAYLIGLDTNEDKLVRASGILFSGANGGSIRNLTLEATGGGVFGLSGSGVESLVVQNCIVQNSSSVGSIANFGLVFNNIIQFSGNTTGITYSSINMLLLNNMGWLGTNTGTFETYTGTFNLIEKVSGFSTVPSGATGVDVSADPAVTDGVLLGTAFSGVGTYVDGYTTGSYPGYNFTNNWFVNAPGIAEETDGVASGNFYFNGTLTTGFSQTIINGIATEVQGNGTFTANSLFRFTSAGGNNRLVYDGLKEREFQINASMSVRVTGAATNFYAFVLAKNGTVLTESNSIVYIDSDTQIQNISINANVNLENGDYIEVYVQRLTGSGIDSLVVFSENLSIK
ncbi:cell wall anchor protein [Tamlana crocina]|uniref:Cell wall anchor protein n=2 Tax=Tamlana crocina TaxID=393006 RepID=A0ABX1DG52_9FLAO|nr:cell wall anchor protein [Tamlana crocina]